MAELPEGSQVRAKAPGFKVSTLVLPGPGPTGPAGPTGPPGPQGIPGTPGENFNPKESVADAASLPTEGNEDGDGRMTEDDGHMHVWNGTAEAWVDAGNWRGAPGGSDAAFAAWINDTDSETYAAGVAQFRGTTGILTPYDFDAVEPVGSNDNTAALTALWAAAEASGAEIYLPPGDWRCTGGLALFIGMKLTGAGARAAWLTRTTGGTEPLFTWDSWVYDVAVSDLGIYGEGAFDLFGPGTDGGVSAATFERLFIAHEDTGSHIWKQDNDASFIQVTFANCELQRPAGSTVPPFWLRTGAGSVNCNKFLQVRLNGGNNTATPFVLIESTAAAAFVNDWTFDGIVGEQNRAGLIHMKAAAGVTIINATDEDAVGDYVDHIIKIDSNASGLASRDVTIINSTRRGSALDTGVNEIYVHPNSWSVTLIGCNPTPTSDAPTVNVPEGAVLISMRDGTTNDLVPLQVATATGYEPVGSSVPARLAAQTDGVSEVTDADTATDSGFYYWTTATGVGSSTEGHLFVVAFSSGYVAQTFFTLGLEQWRRNKLGGTWSSWYRMPDANVPNWTSAVTVSDPSTVVETGIVYWDSAGAIGMSDAHLLSMMWDDDWGTQVAFSLSSAGGVQTWRRTKASGAWSSWERMLTTSDAPLSGRNTAQVTNSTTSYAAVTGLSVDVKAGQAYKVRITGTYQSAATTTGIGFQLGGTATATALRVWSTIWGAATSASTPQKQQLAALASGHLTTATFAANTDYMFEIEGVIRVNAAGTLQLEFKSEVAASQVLVQPDASIVLTPLA